MKAQLLKYISFFILIILNSCQDNIDEIFVDKRIEKLFVEFVEEAKTSVYRDGDKIFISVYSKKSNDQFCLSFDNVKYYNSEDNFAKFNYQGFKVFVNQNVPKSIIKFDKFNHKSNFHRPKGEIVPIQEFLQTWICFEPDSVIIQRVNFENKEFLNVWKKLE